MNTWHRASLRHRHAGFTLVEVLVALLMMALLTALAWQALDSVVRARDEGQASVDRTVRLATVLTQWEQDLQALHDTDVVPPLAFDGQTLRLTRRAEGGVQLVAWAVRSGRWQRWVGPNMVRGSELQEAWLRSQQLLGTEPGTVLLSEGVASWQIYFARGGQWSNAQSSGNVVAVQGPPTPAPAASGASAPQGAVQLREELPEAVRLQIFFGEKPLTRDIALGPAGS
jgi:general secretion pathway protein J